VAFRNLGPDPSPVVGSRVSLLSFVSGFEPHRGRLRLFFGFEFHRGRLRLLFRSEYQREGLCAGEIDEYLSKEFEDLRTLPKNKP